MISLYNTIRRIVPIAITTILSLPLLSCTGFIQRDERDSYYGEWNYAVPEKLPELFIEFNGINFGHAHLAETFLKMADEAEIERARLLVLTFILSSPEVSPDEEQVAPTFTRLVWEVASTFNWAHTLHRDLYDLFADDEAADKDAAYREILKNYLSKPEAITAHRLDMHGKLWSFPESKSFRDTFPKFNAQIWVYHWFQAQIAEMQMKGGGAKQRALSRELIVRYHEYLANPPLEWTFMPMFEESAPEFSKRYPEAAAIFDNLHMLHDNLDDILCRNDLYPTLLSKREAIMNILAIYLHRNHFPDERFAEYHGNMMHRMDYMDHS